MAQSKYVRTFSELGINDVALVGGKNASLGEMYSTLANQGIKVPNGFATTAEAYRYYINHNQLQNRIAEAIGSVDTNDVEKLARTGKTIREWIMHGEMPNDLADEIKTSYQLLAKEYGPAPDVAVRSSATSASTSV